MVYLFVGTTKGAGGALHRCPLFCLEPLVVGALAPAGAVLAPAVQSEPLVVEGSYLPLARRAFTVNSKSPVGVGVEDRPGQTIFCPVSFKAPVFAGVDNAAPPGRSTVFDCPLQFVRQERRIRLVNP